jgi:isoleucyl-tRNA synthetase
MFRPVDSNVHFPTLEQEVLRFWDERKIYEKSLEQRRAQERRAGGVSPPLTDAAARKFVFYEGPPTANGLPHPGHCLTRAIKDLFPRYKTMRGYRCDRKAGWDTHGLPVEVEVCKELGIHSKEEIERFGVEPFIHRCLESVFRYTKQWEELTRRLGFWIHLDEAYVTYHRSYVESVWWALKTLFDRGLLYKGHKIVWWWAQGGTALSSGEVGQGYRQVADPSVYVRFPLLDDKGKDTGTDLLVWTTTPWTLPSNQFATVHPDLGYSVALDEQLGRRLVIASVLVETIAGKVKRELKVERTLQGRELVGRRYLPPFDYYHKSQGQRTGKLKAGGQQHVAWRVTAAAFVTTDSGTGAVHEAPAFGEVDFDLLKEEQSRFVEGQGPPLICAVAPDGTFTAEAHDYQGRWVKDCDKDICRNLRDRGLLYHQEQYLHDYPFCWRAEDDPLIQYPRESWFIRTSQFKQQMLANNARINWLPEHIKGGRFGNFLETNVDWALSRERYWGTPLPIWVCEKTGRMEAIGSYDELLAKPGASGTDVWQKAKQANPKLADHLMVHKPYIDAVTYDSPFAAGARMRISGEVIDCWFDSGAMPFAQWGYRGPAGPADAVRHFDDQFPADFISEALDQTRGWFYSLLAISTLLFGDDEASGGRQPPGNVAARQAPEPDRSHRPANAGRSPEGRRSPAATPYPHPFRNCIVLGLMLSEWWESPDGKERFLNEDEGRQKYGNKLAHKVGKMSKQLRNYPEPGRIFDTHGADALRWFFFANQAPWTSIIYSERAIKETIPEFLLRLWNVYSFFVTYANIDGFDPVAELQSRHLAPRDARLAERDDYTGQLTSGELAAAKTYRPARQRGELDRWLLSELARTSVKVVERMDAYDNYGAAREITDFVDGLSNWYVRRSRERFWSGDQSADKADAYWTLYEALLATAKLIAPFTPFLAEALWQNLAVAPFGGRVAESVHLCDYPTGHVAESLRDSSRLGETRPRAESVIDEALSQQMRLVREIVSLGRSARSEANLKVRQPLPKVEVVLADAAHQAFLEAHSELIRGELNVKEVGFTTHAEEYITYSVLPNLPKLGPRLGKRLPALRKALGAADPAALLRQLGETGQVSFDLPGIAPPENTVALDQGDIQVRLQAKPGWAAAQGRACVVVLNTELTPQLVAEGLARDVVRAVQDHRKAMGLAFTDRIEIGLVTESEELKAAAKTFAEYIGGETLSKKLAFEPLPGVEPVEVNIAGHAVKLYVRKC